jgi:imidazolonepropionase-like amidohydrolase
VVVHAEGPGTVAAALDAGADLLAHTPWTETVDDGLIRAGAARMTWISTLDIHGWGRATPELDTALGNLRRFLGHGGTVRYGTDLGNGPLPPGINARELRALQRAGLGPADILAAMTETDHGEPAWLPDGLDLEPATFADSLATARVITARVRPRR